jgi:serine/threonine protein kinase
LSKPPLGGLCRDSLCDGNNHDSWPVLGRGAGGVTRRVPWKDMDVAVKTFAGELTSDGSPQDEKAISKLVTSTTANDESGGTASEPALIELLGETQKGGALVMEFLEGYSALAGPPSFDTCSRDVYCDASKAALQGFPLWKIATDTLRVLSKLHGLGVSHSDFYAHNILIQPNKNNTHLVKVSDFGAAFRYRCNGNNNDGDDDTFGKLVETVEVRAYAVLVEELFGLTEAIAQDKDDTEHPWKELLEECQTNGATFRALAEKFHS